MDFDLFVDLFILDLTEMWRTSTHYITTDFDRFLEIKYEAYLRKGTI